MTIASLVVDVLANQVQLIRDVEQIQGSLDKVGAMAKKVGTAIAAAFTIDKVIDAGRKVIGYADHISDLSDRLHISTDAAQEWESIFGQAGVSLDTVAKASEQLAVKLVGGDKGAVAALGKLGFNLDALKNMSPEARFNAVADALGRIQNPAEQLYASKTLLGKGGPELLGALDGHLQDSIDKLKAMGIVIDHDLIKAGGEFADKMELMDKVGLALMAEVIVPILPGLMAMAMWLADLASGTVHLAQSLEDSLIKALLQAKAGILEWAYETAVAAANLPIIGKHLALSAGAMDTLRNSAAQAHDQVRLFSTTVQTSTDSTKKHSTALIGLGRDLDAAGTAASNTAKLFLAQMKANDAAWEAMDKTQRDVEETLLQLANRYWKEQIQIAEAGGKKLIEMTLQLNQSLISLDSERIRNLLAINTPGMFAAGSDAGKKVGESFGSSLLGAIKGHLGGLNSIFEAAFTGGGGALGAVKSFATQTLSTVIGLIPGVGPILSQFSGLFIAAFGKIASAFSSIFGGPNAQEKAGRSASDAFTQTLESSLDWMQKIEVHQLVAAGNSQKWSVQVVAIRDAYIKAGHSVDEALAMVDRLWKAEKQGGGAVQEVIDEITRSMHDTLPAAMDEAKNAGLDAFGSVAQGAAAAAESVNGISMAAATAYRMLLQLRGFNGGSSGEGTSEGKDISGILSGLSASQAKDAWLSSIANTGSTSQDWDRVKGQYGFAAGTGGFRDFGFGTSVVLHGREEVRTEAQGRSDGSLLAELKAMRRELKLMTRSMKLAVAMAGAT